MIQDVIIQTAKKYIGQKEIPENKGFVDKKFQELMEIVGWRMDYAWCALFAELVWKEAYSQRDSFVINELDRLFSAGSVQTLINFTNDREWQTGEVPKLGALVIWQNYKGEKPLWTGHTGIVISELNGSNFITVEGNTNSGRGSDMVLKKTRRMIWGGDFRLKGFVYPKEV